jgi:hypothetical protein
VLISAPAVSGPFFLVKVWHRCLRGQRNSRAAKYEKQGKEMCDLVWGCLYWSFSLALVPLNQSQLADQALFMPTHKTVSLNISKLSRYLKAGGEFHCTSLVKHSFLMI